MSVVSVHRHFENDSPESAQQGQQGLTQSILYMVTYSSPMAGDALDAIFATDGTRSIPAYYSLHPTIVGASVVNKTSRRIGKSASFYVQVDYGVPPLIAFEVQPGGTDVRWNKRLSRSSAKDQEGVNKDYHGVPLENAAGTIYPPDIPKPVYDTQYTISFNLDTLVTFGAACNNCQGKVNTSAVTLNVDGFFQRFDPGTLLCAEADWNWQKMPDGSYQRQGTLVLLYRSLLADGQYLNAQNSSYDAFPVGTELGWATIVVNKGKYYINDNNDLLPAAQDVMLKPDGTLLDDGADPFLNVFQTIFDIEFTTLLHGI